MLECGFLSNLLRKLKSLRNGGSVTQIWGTRERSREDQSPVHLGIYVYCTDYRTSTLSVPLVRGLR